jgi:hypothetical protein
MYLPASAQQFSRDMVHKGEIDLSTGETLKGLIRYDLDKDNLIFQAGSMVRSYFSTSVEAWQIQDALNNKIRYFYTIPFSVDGTSYKKPTFFELLYEGDALTLLAREKIIERVENMHDPFWFGGRSMRVMMQEDNFYFMDSNGDVHACGDFESMMKFMRDQEKQVVKFIKANNLKIDRRSDMIQIVSYYNSIKSQ